jgi:hypothetical protein
MAEGVKWSATGAWNYPRQRMGVPLIVPPIAILAESAAALVLEAGENRPRANALNKAMLALHDGVTPVHSHDGWLIESRTRSIVHRVSIVHGCGCEAGQAQRACWHKAMLDIIEHAQMRAIPLADRLAAARWVSYEKAVADMDELFAA